MTNNQLAIRNKLTPDVWAMIESVAMASFESRKFGIVKQGEASMKLLFCYENNLPLSASNTGLYIVNGKLAVQSNIIAAKFKQHPNYRYAIKTHNDTECTIEVFEKLDNEWVLVGVSSFTENDAKKAGLLSKEVWRNYPRNMYFGRAITNAYRWYAPDILSQPVYIPEELNMRVDGEGSPIIDGQYSVVEKQMTAIDLCNKYNVDAAEILRMNNGKMPSTQEDIERLDSELAAMQNEDGNE
jgi:hypothetical protein